MTAMTVDDDHNGGQWKGKQGRKGNGRMVSGSERDDGDSGKGSSGEGIMSDFRLHTYRKLVTLISLSLCLPYQFVFFCSRHK